MRFLLFVLATAVAFVALFSHCLFSTQPPLPPDLVTKGRAISLGVMLIGGLSSYFLWEQRRG